MSAFALIGIIAAQHPLKGQEPQSLSVQGRGVSVQLDRTGNIQQIRSGANTFVPPVPYSFFELDRQLSEARHVSGASGLSFELASETMKGTLTLSSGPDVRFSFKPAAGKPTAVGLVLTFPEETEFHLAEFKNVGRLLDKRMPIGDQYGGPLWYDFFLAKTNGMWLRFHSSDKKALNKSEFHVVRHPRMFTVTYTWQPGSDLAVAAFSSLEEAVADYESWLKNEIGIRELKDKNVPDWLRNIKLVVTADMLRSNGEIAHSYDDVLKLARELQKLRDPHEILLYLPGWQGPYDSVHPTYRPHPALGGEAKFKELMDYTKRAGFRVMIHSTVWGIDPYHPDIDRLQQLAAKHPDGRYKGWMMPDKKLPRPRQVKFRTPRLPLRAPVGTAKFNFKTDPIPTNCEALITVGGIRAKQVRVRLTLGDRTVSSPPDWFATHDSYAFPYALAMTPGVNEVQVEVTGGDPIDWSKSWYQITDTYGGGPFASWTFPILMAESSHPEFVAIHTGNIRNVVKEFGIDAVHTDAGSFYNPVRAKELFLKLREELPGVVLASEFYQTLEEMDYWHLTQAARQSLRDYNAILPCPCEQMHLKPSSGVREMYSWLDVPSPVCGFVKKYVVSYPHLCAADAFVPVGKVCNMYPERQMPPDKNELWQTMRDAKKFDYVPGIRVNFRKYGIDPDLRKYLQELQ